VCQSCEVVDFDEDLVTRCGLLHTSARSHSAATCCQFTKLLLTISLPQCAYQQRLEFFLYGAVDHCRWSVFLFHWGGIPERGIGILVYVLLFLGVSLFPDKILWKIAQPISSGCWFVGGDDLTGALHDL